jgi:hypothetical protein
MRAPVAGGEQLRLAALTTLPHGADGMNDVRRGQAVTLGDLGIAGFAAAEQTAFLEQSRTRGTVDGAVDAATA